MTLEKIFDTYDMDEVEHFKLWLRMEIVKMIDEADIRHLIFTTYDQDRVAAVKEAITNHVLKEWEL